MDLAQYIRNIPDWPKPGVIFRDITTLLKVPEAFREAVDRLAEPFMDKGIDLVVSIEARGFIFGGALAYKLGAGFIPARKPGKLPAETVRQEYALEYGTDAVEIHKDAIKPGQKVLLFDDVLATGGTMEATAKLVEKLGGEVVGIAFLIDLTYLKGREKLTKYPIHALIYY